MIDQPSGALNDLLHSNMERLPSRSPRRRAGTNGHHGVHMRHARGSCKTTDVLVMFYVSEPWPCVSDLTSLRMVVEACERYTRRSCINTPATPRSASCAVVVTARPKSRYRAYAIRCGGCLVVVSTLVADTLGLALKERGCGESLAATNK